MWKIELTSDKRKIAFFKDDPFVYVADKNGAWRRGRRANEIELHLANEIFSLRARAAQPCGQGDVAPHALE